MPRSYRLVPAARALLGAALLTASSQALAIGSFMVDVVPAFFGVDTAAAALGADAGNSPYGAGGLAQALEAAFGTPVEAAPLAEAAPMPAALDRLSPTTGSGLARGAAKPIGTVQP